MGQGLLVKRMKKNRVIAETGAGCMGRDRDDGGPLGIGMRDLYGGGDGPTASQRFLMEQLGAKVISVTEGSLS